ncbi:Lrp/AsnC family transcriptional regulator [Haloferacaceae archaeon DSL9]
MKPNLTPRLDSADMAILHALQRDARNTTTEAIGEQVGLAASTVATRINDLEERGVITGYAPSVNFNEAGFDQHHLLVGTITAENRDETVEAAAAIENIVSIRELMVDEENIHIELVSQSQSRAEKVIEELNDIGIEIKRTEIVKRRLDRAFNHFGKKFVTNE